MREHIVVVDDNETMRLGVTESLKREGFHISDFADGNMALECIIRDNPDVVVSDLKMEPMDGLELLSEIKERLPDIDVILISAYGTIDTAVKAMQLGAADFLTKPFSPEELRVRVHTLLQRRQKLHEFENLKEQHRLLKEDLSGSMNELIGSSPQIREVMNLVARVAVKDSAILIQGESGTGKELIARAIHNASRRKDAPFIKVNCGVLNDNLLESELFGHEKGAFTGAIRLKKGRFELADSGTLLLDEVGDISASMQIKLLRVLQEGSFERVGGEKTLQTDVRIVSATNRDIRRLMAEGKFREDLFYRLSVVPVEIPPLRTRRSDIPELTGYFLNKIAAKYHQPVKIIDEEGLSLLSAYPWPGNIRELENLVERLVVISQVSQIDAGLIARHLSKDLSAGTVELPLDKALYEFERRMIIEALRQTRGVKNRAAKLLGIKTSALYYKLEKFKLI